MNLTIRHVDTNNIQQIWSMVKPFLAEAMDKGDEADESMRNYTMDHIQMFLTSGQWLLLVAVDEELKIHGAATVSFINYPMHRAAFVTAIGGKLLINEDTCKQLAAALKARGATKIQGLVRPAMERFLHQFGFEPRNKLVEVLI